MKIQKFEHATLAVWVGGSRLVIDPGAFLSGLDNWNDVAAIVVTHEHPDHWTERNLERARDANPGVPIFSTQAVATAAPALDITVVHPGETVTLDDFELRFFGGRHQLIHESIPVIDNVGVLVNETLYYPGDSYAVPDGVEVDVLAAPLGAPWLRIADAIDFVIAVAPRNAFGTHDMTLSTIGKDIHRQRLDWATQQHGGTFHVLEPGDELVV